MCVFLLSQRARRLGVDGAGASLSLVVVAAV
jgi:hypothetical protein